MSTPFRSTLVPPPFVRSIIATTPLLALAAPLAAQEPSPQSERQLETVTVTGVRERAYRSFLAPAANKSEASGKETPFSIQTVTRELIEDRGVTSFGEAVRTIPGLTPQVGWGGTNDRFRLRGFATASNLKNGFRRSVFAPVDELVNIEQIEVLKGPASALYGRFEPGGAVNLVTKKPLNKAQTQIDLTAGSESFYRATVDSTGPISDTLGYRLTGSWQHNGSFRDFVDADTKFISPVFQWKLSADTKVTAELEYGRKKSGFDRGFGNSPLFLNVPISTNYGEPDAHAVNESMLASLVIDHRLGNGWDLRAGVQSSSANTRALWYPYGFPPVSAAGTANPQVNRRKQLSEDDQRDTTAMLEASRKFATGAATHRILIGADANRDRWDFTTQANLGPAGFPVNLPISLYNPVHGTVAGPLLPYDARLLKSRSIGLYAQDEIGFGKQWRVLLGARYDRTRSSTTASQLPGGAMERTDAAVSPRVGVTWTPVEPMSLYASWSRSFLTEASSGMLRSRALPEPSIGKQIETGIKLSLLEERLEPTIAVFDIRRQKGIVADPQDFNYVIQVGEQRSRGWEVDVPYIISPRWRLLASFTRMKAEISEDSDPALVGNTVANAPRRTASLWSTYDLSGAASGWSIGLGAVYVGERQANTANTFTLTSYTRWDANMAYRFGAAQRYKLQLTVQNLGDKRYYESGGSFVPTYPGAPRTVLATLGIAL